MPKVVFKFQDDPTVNKSGIIVLLGHVWVYADKKRILEEEEERGLAFLALCIHLKLLRKIVSVKKIQAEALP